MGRGSNAVKAKPKNRRAAVKRRAVPERMRSDLRVERHPNAGKRITDGHRDNAGLQAGDAVSVAASAASNPSIGSDPPQRPIALMRGISHTTATSLPGFQAWFLFPLRAFQIWQNAWFGLLPR